MPWHRLPARTLRLGAADADRSCQWYIEATCVTHSRAASKPELEQTVTGRRPSNGDGFACLERAHSTFMAAILKDMSANQAQKALQKSNFNNGGIDGNDKSLNMSQAHKEVEMHSILVTRYRHPHHQQQRRRQSSQCYLLSETAVLPMEMPPL